MEPNITPLSHLTEAHNFVMKKIPHTFYPVVPRMNSERQASERLIVSYGFDMPA